MSEAMSVPAAPAPVVHDFDHAYKLGRLCGEVRVLKWGAGAALAVIVACMGVLYEAIDDVRVGLVETRKDVSVLQTDMAGIRKNVADINTRLTTIEEDVAVLKEDVAVLKEDVAVLKEDVAVLKEDVAVLKEDVAVLKEDVAVLKEDVAVLKEDVAILKGLHSTWMEDAHDHHGNSHDFPKRVDSAREPVAPAPATPPA